MDLPSQPLLTPTQSFGAARRSYFQLFLRLPMRKQKKYLCNIMMLLKEPGTGEIIFSKFSNRFQNPVYINTVLKGTVDEKLKMFTVDSA